MPSATTRAAPPVAAPAMMCADSPPYWMNVLIDGLGPMYVASIAPAVSASIAAGPALKTEVVMSTASELFRYMARPNEAR